MSYSLKEEIGKFKLPIEVAGRLFSASPQDVSFFCALCGVAMNEVEGFLSSNLTETEIQQALNITFCSRLVGTELLVCEFVVKQVPFAISQITNPNKIM